MKLIKSIEENVKKKLRDCNDGSTMVVAIIIIAVLIVFTFSLMLITYTLYASQNKRISSMKCSEAANTLSLAIGKDIDAKRSIDEDECPEKKSYLYQYLRYNIYQDSTWPYYLNDNDAEHNKEVATRYFRLINNKKTVYDKEGEPLTVGKKTETAEGENSENPDDDDDDENPDYLTTDSGIEGKPGRTEVSIYWMPPKDKKEEDIHSMSDFGVEGIRLFITVTCEAGNQSYSVTREYVLQLEDYEDAEDDRLYALQHISDRNLSMINPMSLSLGDNPHRWVWVPAEN